MDYEENAELEKKGSDLTILLMFNAHHAPVEFTFPEVSGRAPRALDRNAERVFDAPRKNTHWGLRTRR
jgi:hypothetical protein